MMRKSRPLSPNNRASNSSSCSSSSSSRDNRLLSVGFHYDDLERFLCFSIALFCNDAELAASAMAAASGLSSRWQEKGIESFPADVANVAMILDAFITMTSRNNNINNNDSNNQNRRNDNNNSRTTPYYSSNTKSSRPLPANVVYEVHSFMGLLNMAQKNDAAAKVSFMKALWISAAMSTNHNSNKDDGMTTTASQNHSKSGCGYELALTLHRLGKIYARSSAKSSSNYAEAKNLLTKAMEQYEKKSTTSAAHQQLSHKDCQALLLDVKKELEQLEQQERQRRQRQRKSSLSRHFDEEASESTSFSLRSRAFRSLPFILEEKTTSQQEAAERRRYSSAN